MSVTWAKYGPGGRDSTLDRGDDLLSGMVFPARGFLDVAPLTRTTGRSLSAIADLHCGQAVSHDSNSDVHTSSTWP